MSSPLPELTSDQRDAAAELLNMGAGKSAASLSRMVGREILLTVPSIDLVPADEAERRLREAAGDTVAGVSQEFRGTFSGEALLLFPSDRSLELARLLTDEEVGFDEFTELEQDVLTEVGNVVLNGCLSCVANMLSGAFETETPLFTHGRLEPLVRRAAADGGGALLLAEIGMTVRDSSIQGMLLLALPMVSLLDFQDAMNRLMAGS